MDSDRRKKIAVWGLTENSLALATNLARRWEGERPPVVFGPKRLAGPWKESQPFTGFDRLSSAVSEHFSAFDGHLFIMATGIVVRMIAPMIRNKTVDPGVLVMDEKGRYIISLLSGHIGGANRLCRTIARLTGAAPVITTATDVNEKPAIDEIAAERGLLIDNPGAIKDVNMAVLRDEVIRVADPHHILDDVTARSPFQQTDGRAQCDVYVGEVTDNISSGALILRPPVLVVGIGCNRGTAAAHIREHLTGVFEAHHLSVKSISRIATIDIKKDETGIVDLAGQYNLPLVFYSKEALNRVEDQITPSLMAEKYTGAKNVCEAAAILASNNGHLIIPKTKTREATLAVARQPMPSMW